MPDTGTPLTGTPEAGASGFSPNLGPLLVGPAAGHHSGSGCDARRSHLTRVFGSPGQRGSYALRGCFSTSISLAGDTRTCHPSGNRRRAPATMSVARPLKRPLRSPDLSGELDLDGDPHWQALTVGGDNERTRRRPCHGLGVSRLPTENGGDIQHHFTDAHKTRRVRALIAAASARTSLTQGAVTRPTPELLLPRRPPPAEVVTGRTPSIPQPGRQQEPAERTAARLEKQQTGNLRSQPERACGGTRTPPTPPRRR